MIKVILDDGFEYAVCKNGAVLGQVHRDRPGMAPVTDEAIAKQARDAAARLAHDVKVGRRQPTVVSAAYAGSSREAIGATLGLLRHFRAFLASSCAEMRDPFEIAMWRDGASRLNKAAARARLRWLVLIAILRKGWWIEDAHSREHAPGLNHRGAFPRNRTGDAQRHLRQLADRINSPRLIVRTSELGEWKPYLLRRLPHRFTNKWDA